MIKEKDAGGERWRKMEIQAKVTVYQPLQRKMLCGQRRMEGADRYQEMEWGREKKRKMNKRKKKRETLNRIVRRMWREDKTKRKMKRKNKVVVGSDRKEANRCVKRGKKRASRNGIEVWSMT